MWFKWRQLRTRLLALFIGLLLVPILGTGIYGRLYFGERLEEQAIAIAQHDVSAQLSHVETRLHDAQQALTYLSNVRALQVLENSAPATELYQSSLQVLGSDLTSFAETHPIYHRLAIYNPVGEPVLLLNRNNDEPQVFDTQVPDTYGEFVAQVLPSETDTLHMTVDVGDSNQTSTVVLALRAQQSIIILELWTEWLFRPAIDNNTIGIWSVRLPINVILHYAAEDNVSTPTLQNNNIWFNQQHGHFSDNNTISLFERATIPTLQNSYDIVLFHTVPTHYFQTDLSDFYRSYGLLIIGVMLCVIALSLFAIDRFIDPIQKLKAGVDTMRKTQQPPALPDELPPDEIGDLSLAFHTMAIELAEKRQAERALVDKLITAQEEERKRIAYELHDGLIQQLVGARLQLSHSRDLLTDDRMKQAYEQGYEALSTAIVEGRRIMQGLHPSILDDLGIVAALRELCHSISEHAGWSCQLDLQPLKDEPDRITSVTLYRIVQEALNNAHKHANAQTMQITLWQDDGYHLVIKDDGVGFGAKPLPKANGGWGLRTMTERVDLLYGKIDIDSSIGGGTAIEVYLPIKDNMEGND